MPAPPTPETITISLAVGFAALVICDAWGARPTPQPVDVDGLSARQLRKAKWVEEKKKRKQGREGVIQANKMNASVHAARKVEKERGGSEFSQNNQKNGSKKRKEGKEAKQATVLGARLMEECRIDPSLFVEETAAEEKQKAAAAPACRSFLYVVGGRLRGRTLTVVERLDITTLVHGPSSSPSSSSSSEAAATAAAANGGGAGSGANGASAHGPSSWERCPYLTENRGRSVVVRSRSCPRPDSA
jgi:hypothetical protein